MEVFKHTLKDTVVLEVEIENLNEEATDIELVLYQKTSAKGLVDEIKKISPTDIKDNKIIFKFDTDDFLTRPRTYYGRFSINNNNNKLNIFYKFKARY